MNAQSLEQGRDEHRWRARTTLFCVVNASDTSRRKFEITHSLWVFENRVFRKISRRNSGEVRGEWCRLYIEGLQGLCSKLNFFRVIKSIKGRLARKCMYEGKIRHLEDLDEKKKLFLMT
jgi:hypothetical protein